MVIAQLLNKMDKTQEAIDEYRSLLEKDPSLVNANMELGVLLEQDGDTVEAKRHYRRALELDREFAPAANNLAWILAQEENPDLGEALRLALVAKEQKPDDPHIADTLGWIHYKRESYDLALTQFALANTALPNIPTIEYHLALALHKQGELEQAKEILKKCLESKDDFPERKDAEILLKEIG